MTVTSRQRSAAVGGWTGAIVDTDVHINVPSVQALLPYLEAHWVEYIRETGFTAPPSPATKYPAGAAITCAPQWRLDDGRPGATELSQLQSQLLDPLGVEIAIVNPYWGIESIRHPDLAAALASAVNDWLIAEWLERDDRLRGSIVVPAYDPVAAAREIDRVGGHPGVVQVFLPVWSPVPYGRRSWHPMLEAICRHDLVAGLHYGGSSEGAPTPNGWPSWYLEEYAGATAVYWAQLLSLLAEGAFAQFPQLRVSLLEGGFAWLPPLLWRTDKEWKGLRREVPWVDRLPSQILREHVMLSSQPLDAGPADEFARLVQWLGAGELLMFATDYPHGHESGAGPLLDVVPADEHAAVMADNARRHYRLTGA
jgi:predicted TIM-barrel fold metal-dependent hydrolase